uniref:GIY endonuclease n=1 Tax=Purpureocillium takamizusanense TaxID=2060973 RepID=UPI001FA797C6|nr:GIY endonuclease [Purpureocillium takamizusanense]UNI92577.1 GIY endonuclease [Purpureocillium takamizusanense]
MMKNIQIWYDLDKKGYIIDKDNNIIIRPLLQRPAIYVYKIYLNDKEKLYVGSTINMVQRFRQHKYRAELYATKLRYNSMLYNYVTEYGWNSFKFGIVKYLDFYPENEWPDKKDVLLKMEQKYIDLWSPDLNINKTAGSMLGFKHAMYNKLDFGYKIKKELYKKNESLKPLINKETILKLKLHNKDITVSIYDVNNILIREFNRIKTAAEFVGLSASSVSGYIKSGKLWNKKYYFKLKVNTILDKSVSNFPLDNSKVIIKSNAIVNKNSKSYKLEVIYKDEVIYKFRSIREASKYLNISKITLTKYSIENKLWKHKFKFRIN